MNLNELLEIIKNPEKILSGIEIEKAIEGCTFWIMRMEEDLADLEEQINDRMYHLGKEGQSVAASKVIVKHEEPYKESKRVEIIYKALKGLRSNLRRKYERLFKNY